MRDEKGAGRYAPFRHASRDTFPHASRGEGGTFRFPTIRSAMLRWLSRFGQRRLADHLEIRDRVHDRDSLAALFVDDVVAGLELAMGYALYSFKQLHRVRPVEAPVVDRCYLVCTGIDILLVNHQYESDNWTFIHSCIGIKLALANAMASEDIAICPFEQPFATTRF